MANSPSVQSPQVSPTILSVLVDKGFLTKEQAATVPVSGDNAALEDLLISRHLVSSEEILQAYAILYNIPFVRLKKGAIDLSVLNKIPEVTARQYDIIAYDEEGGIVRVAVASPGRLAQTDRKAGVLHRLQDELGIKIAPALAPLEDIRAAHDLYAPSVDVAARQLAAKKLQQPAPVQPTSPTSIPVSVATDSTAQAPAEQSVSLVGMMIPPAVLKKFPQEIANKYQLVPFAEPEPAHLHIAALNPQDPEVVKLLGFLKERNGLKLTVFLTDPDSLSYALKQYVEAPVTTASVRAAREAANLEAAKRLDTRIQPVAPVAPAVSTPEPTLNAPEVRAEDIAVHGDQLTPLQNQLLQPTADQQDKDAEEAAAATTAAENILDTFLNTEIKSVTDLVNIIKTGNVPKMVAAIVALAIAMRASDIHIEATRERVRLRYRIDGELEDILLMPRVLLPPIVSRVKILSELKIDENRIPQDGRFDVRFKQREIDLRISTLPTVHGEKVVMRILDKTSGIMSLEDMGLSGKGLERLVKNIEKPYGIILATGPTGSGKSTTLYAILQRIAKAEVNVITLEDPVEYEIKGINQTQIKPKIGFTFAEGLRSILRQDPNIIMVGEIRDGETAEMATHAALTGHLMLSTLHTNDASGALPRLINMGVEPFLITSSMNAVIGQRLVRRVCQNCKFVAKLPDGVIERIKREIVGSNVDAQFQDPAKWKFYEAKGCDQCNNGYRGRIGIFEILTMSETIEALAVKKAPASAIAEQAVKEGMVTMKQDGIVKALEGQTTIEEVMKATTE